MAVSQTLFDFNDYRNYLNHVLPTSGEQRGQRAKLAVHLKCQTSFISQVFTKRTQLSHEQALLVSDFLSHSNEERKFFMLLVQKERAGSKRLEDYVQQQLEEIRRNREVIQTRIHVSNNLSNEDRSIYYSTWYYAAIHVLAGLPHAQTREKIAQHLKAPLSFVGQHLEFLLSRGLVEEKSGKLSMGVTRIHLEQNSPFLPRHHANWRMQAIGSVDFAYPDDLHYSGVVSVSKADAKKMKTMLLDFIEKIEPMIRESKEEEAVCVVLDLFRI